MMGLQSPPDALTKANGAVSMTERDSERKPAKLFGPIVSLQRVWKTYVKGGEELQPSGSLSSLSSDGDDTPGYIPSISFTPADSGQDLESDDDGMNTSSGSTSGQNIPDLESRRASTHLGVDSETESVVSDYSEMADPVKEHIANVHIICCPDLDPTSPTQFLVREKVLRGMGEGEEDFVRRLRKTNFLSLAQEFADLKRQNENALPFNLHKKRYRERKESESETDEIEGISVDSRGTVDISLSGDDPEGGYDSGWQDETPVQPEAYLDNGNFVGAKSKHNYECPMLVEANRAVETHSGNAVLISDVTGKSVEMVSTENVPDVVSDPPSILPCARSDIDLSSSYVVGERETICNRRDCSGSVDDLERLKMVEDLDDCTIEKVFPQWDWKGLEDELMREAEDGRILQPGSRGDREEILQRLAMLDEEEWYSREIGPSHVANPQSMGICYVNEAADDLDPDNWGSYDSPRPDVVPFDHNSEEAEELNDHSSADDLLAKQATLEAEARMALAQVRPMAQLQSKSNIQMQERLGAEMIGTASSEEKISRHISQQTLERMTEAQLQIFANDLRAQIEVLNLDLMLSLVERDDLHMVQDSMLVDIEDLTGRAREYAARVDGRRQEKLQVQKCV